MGLGAARLTTQWGRVAGGLRNGAVDQANWIEMVPPDRIERHRSGDHGDREIGETQACLGSTLPWWDAAAIPSTSTHGL